MSLFRYWLAILLLAAAAGRAAGDRFLPLGGFYGNMLPPARLRLTPAELERVEPYLWTNRIQKFGNQFVGVPVPGLLDSHFSLPAGRSKGRLIDLNQGVEESVDFTIPNTRDDFVLVIAPQELRRRAGIAATEHACNVSVSC